ncbi:MAG: hypothetical protein JW934_00395 [Anaerolineae bacterium]|nr:hypothetical protein [Anaerolineae bacterium]
MELCPACGEKTECARVVCGGCGQELPLRVVVISQASWGSDFAVIAEQIDAPERKEQSYERCCKDE